MSGTHVSEELAHNPARVAVQTKYGPVTGGRAANGAVVFLEVPFALPPGRFEDPKAFPDGFRYEDRVYIHETAYAVQPDNDGQARGVPPEDKLGLGQPTENPLFVNIVIPPAFPASSNFPVKVYVHGGFLQFGSPHGLGSQAQYIAAERNEIWVNMGYRLSAFGFLAADKPRIDGNFGFKDQWLALEWVKENIASFGGDPSDIQISGLSAGAHSVHQILHHASRLPPGQMAPFHSAILQSNSIATDPKTPAELQPQFEAFCEALDLDPSSPDILSTLRDPAKVPWQSITAAIETKLLSFGTFRGCLDDAWLAASPGPMAWQRSGGFADGLRRAGVTALAVGDLTEEWYLYSIAHPIHTPRDIVPNLRRYYPDALADAIHALYRPLGDDAGAEASAALFGEILCDGQVHLPVRLLAQDLIASGFPVLRYEIRWTPEQVREAVKGYVTHGTDRPLWAFRVPVLKPEQLDIARQWLATIDLELRSLEQAGRTSRGVKEILTLKEDKSIGWTDDQKYDDVMRLTKVLPGEDSV